MKFTNKILCGVMATSYVVATAIGATSTATAATSTPTPTTTTKTVQKAVAQIAKFYDIAGYQVPMSLIQDLKNPMVIQKASAVYFKINNVDYANKLKEINKMLVNTKKVSQAEATAFTKVLSNVFHTGTMKKVAIGKWVRTDLVVTKQTVSFVLPSIAQQNIKDGGSTVLNPSAGTGTTVTSNPNKPQTGNADGGVVWGDPNAKKPALDAAAKKLVNIGGYLVPSYFNSKDICSRKNVQTDSSGHVTWDFDIDGFSIDYKVSWEQKVADFKKALLGTKKFTEKDIAPIVAFLLDDKGKKTMICDQNVPAGKYTLHYTNNQGAITITLPKFK